MIHYQDESVTLHHGHSLDVLRTLPDQSVNCCVTSPPYFGLRDYGEAGQYGLEPSPAAYVEAMRELFAEVRRVLADDGTLWLNLGDSYSAGNGSKTNGPQQSRNGQGVCGPRDLHPSAARASLTRTFADVPAPKNLLGIPWLVARALQQPQYVGNIREVADRAWLAGWIDGEGTISYVERDRGPDHSPTHDVRVFVTNCDDAPLRQFAGICGGRVYVHDDGTRENRYGKRVVYRWQMGTHESAMVLREVYPYLRTKRKQAALIWTLFTTLRHQNGHARTPADVIARRREIAVMVRVLNTGADVDLPAWVTEPPAAEEPGWILRNDIIWAKPNAMPESVTDRLSTRHELIFLFSKSRRYWFDWQAIAEPIEPENQAHYDRYAAMPARSIKINADRNDQGGNGTHCGFSKPGITVRRPGDVWTIPTQPFPGAHFAVFPVEIPRRCIAAGCAPRVCRECGHKPTRIIEKADRTEFRESHAHRGKTALDAAGRNDGDKKSSGQEFMRWRAENPDVTTGWTDCGHNAYEAGTVLDPFSGSGTTGLAAGQLGRKYIGIDLSRKYLDLSLQTRLAQTALLDGGAA